MPTGFAVDEEVLFHIDKRENNVKDCRFHSLVVCCPFIACRQGQSVPDRNLARFDRSFDLRFSNTIAENLSDKTTGTANFSLYVLDKDKARIGEGYINLTNIGAGQTVKFQITLSASGNPTSVAVSTLPRATVSITLNFGPQGAVLKVDGKEAGTTPKIVDVAIGTRLNSAKRVSRQGSSRLKLLRVMRPAQVSATNWAALRTIPSSYGTGRF